MPNNKKGPCWKHAVNKAEKRLDIILHEDIGFWGTQSKDFAKLLVDNKDVDIINVDINSYGGSVYDGFSIYNMLKAHKATIKTNNSGIAASIASVIYMAADLDNRNMAENAMLMQHRPFLPFTGGDADDLQNDSDRLLKLENNIAKIYADGSNKTVEETLQMMKDVTWLTAEEAKNEGFVGTISEEVEVLNKADLDSYGYKDVPEHVRARLDINYKPVKAPTNINEEKFIDKLKSIFSLKKEPTDMADNTELQNKFDELSGKFTALEKDFKAKSEADATKIKDLETVVENQAKQLKDNAANAKRDEFRNYCENLVKEGKMKPADVDVHVDVLSERLRADEVNFTDEKQETPLLDSYKKVLESNVVVDTSGNHFANKKDGGDKAANNEAEIDKKIKEIMKRDGADMGKAYNTARREHPELF